MCTNAQNIQKLSVPCSRKNVKMHQIQKKKNISVNSRFVYLPHNHH